MRPAGVPKRISSLSQQVDVFVQNSAGTKPIYSILVANNGIAAVKFIRSIRKWAYTTFGSEKAICLVAMATHMDIKSNAEHIHMADQFVEVPGGSSAENYGNVKLIVQIASQAAVDAVWPGWCDFCLSGLMHPKFMLQHHTDIKLHRLLNHLTLQPCARHYHSLALVSRCASDGWVHLEHMQGARFRETGVATHAA